MTTVPKTDVLAADIAEEKRIRWGSIVLWFCIGVLIFITLFPFYWVLRTALTDPTTLFAHASEFLPHNPTLFNFQRVLGMIDPATLVGSAASNLSAGTLNFGI